MKYCVIKNTARAITQGLNEESLICQAVNTEFNGILLTEYEIEILTEEEYQSKKALEPKPPKPLSEIEKLKIESAQANAELFEMVLMMTGGM